MLTLRSSLFCLLFSLLFANCKNASPSQSGEVQQTEHENKQDGIEEAMAQEFKMTKDPALNIIPSERLAFAQQTAERLSRNNQRTMGLAWQERGPDNIGGRTRALLVDKNDPTGNTVFAGSVGGGIWKCTGFKSTTYAWTKINDNMENLAVTVIAQDPLTPSVMYAGTGEGYGNVDAIRGGGIFKSTDGGSNWSVLQVTVPSLTIPTNYDYAYVQDIVVTSTGIVYAACKATKYCNYGGVFKSIDGGLSWTRVIGAFSSGSTCIGAGNDLEIAANGDLYATTGLSGSSTNTYGHVFKSPASLGSLQGDAGQWTHITPTPPSGEPAFRRIELACAPSNPQILYLLCQKYNGSSVTMFYKSINGGTSWTDIIPPIWCDQGTQRADFTRSQAWYDLIATFDPANANNLFIGGVDIMESFDGGANFTQATRWNGSTACGTMPVVHSDNHNILFINGSSSEMIVSNDGGIYYSADGGLSFTKKVKGYNVTQYYGVAMNPTAGSNSMLAGAQDNGTHRFSTAGINTVTTATGGDGGLCFIDQQDPTYQIASYVYCNYYISRNNGSSFGFGTSDNSGDFINPSDYDEITKNLFCSYNAGQLGRLYIPSGTPTIVPINIPGISGQYVSAVKHDKNTPGRVYISAESGTPTLIRIDNAQNATPTFTDISIPGAISNSYTSCIDIEPGNANHLLVTFSNYGVVSVYESVDGGATWTNIEGNLPDMPVRGCIFLPENGRIALATELGVWTTSTPVGTVPVWLPDNNGLANVEVNMLTLRSSDNTLAVSTHGRGVFTTSLGTSTPERLLSLTAALKNENAMLEWKTATEAGSSHFEIERSGDGEHYRKMGEVKAAGNSNRLLTYNFADKEKADELNFYRLKMVDNDGQSTYSNVVKLKNPSAKQNMKVLNNVFADHVDLRFSKALSGSLTMQVADMNGRVVKRETRNVGSQTLIRLDMNASALRQGAYVLTAFTNGETFSAKIIKQ